MVLGMGGEGRVIEDVAEGAAAPALVYCGLYRLLVLTPFMEVLRLPAKLHTGPLTFSVVLSRMGLVCPRGQFMWRVVWAQSHPTWLYM